MHNAARPSSAALLAPVPHTVSLGLQPPLELEESGLERDKPPSTALGGSPVGRGLNTGLFQWKRSTALFPTTGEAGQTLHNPIWATLNLVVNTGDGMHESTRCWRWLQWCEGSGLEAQVFKAHDFRSLCGKCFWTTEQKEACRRCDRSNIRSGQLSGSSGGTLLTLPCIVPKTRCKVIMKLVEFSEKRGKGSRIRRRCLVQRSNTCSKIKLICRRVRRK